MFDVCAECGLCAYVGDVGNSVCHFAKPNDNRHRLHFQTAAEWKIMSSAVSVFVEASSSRREDSKHDMILAFSTISDGAKGI